MSVINSHLGSLGQINFFSQWLSSINPSRASHHGGSRQLGTDTVRRRTLGRPIVLLGTRGRIDCHAWIAQWNGPGDRQSPIALRSAAGAPGAISSPCP